MKFTKLYFAIVGLLIAFGLQGCVDGENESSTLDDNNSIIEGNNSRVQFKLVDAPGPYDEVWVHIIDIQYNSSEDEGGWRSFESFEEVTVDLRQLVAGNSLLLADEIIESGMLKQIRLILSEEGNEVVIGGESFNLDTPSAQQSGLKIKLNEELEPGFTYSYVLDWDVNKSIVEAGKSGKYILKPVINASAEASSGSIAGNVVGKLNIDDADPVVLEGVEVNVYAVGTPDNIYITNSITDENGDFILQGLDPEQSYVLEIIHEGYEEYMTIEGNEINVVAGEVTVLSESIELLLPKSITGNVKGEVLGTDPVSLDGVTVIIFASSDPETMLFSTITDSEGNFFFRGLDSDAYVLKINHDGYEEYMTQEGNEIEVVAGELTVLDEIVLLLYKSITGNISGEVVDADPVSLEGVTVNIFASSDTDTLLYTAITDSEGIFFFRGLDTGAYVLKISHTGYTDYESTDVNVVSGELTNITESILLTLVP